MVTINFGYLGHNISTIYYGSVLEFCEFWFGSLVLGLLWGWLVAYGHKEEMWWRCDEDVVVGLTCVSLTCLWVFWCWWLVVMGLRVLLMVGGFHSIKLFSPLFIYYKVCFLQCFILLWIREREERDSGKGIREKREVWKIESRTKISNNVTRRLGLGIEMVSF